MDQYVDQIGVTPDRGNDISGLRNIAGEMGVFAASLFDAARQQFRGLVGAGYAHDIVPSPGKGLGDIGAETFRRTGQQQRAPG